VLKGGKLAEETHEPTKVRMKKATERNQNKFDHSQIGNSGRLVPVECRLQ